MPEAPPLKGRIYLKQAEITSMDVDAIVNPANNDLILGSDISGAIRRIGGQGIQEECHAIGTIPLGEAAVTSAGSLPARHIIHIAVQPLGLWADAKWVRNGIRSALRRAVEKKAKSIAFPAIGAGAGAFPLDRCAEILLDELTAHLRGETTLEEAYLVLHEPKSFEIFTERAKEKLPGADLTPPSRAMRADDPAPTAPLPPDPPPAEAAPPA